MKSKQFFYFIHLGMKIVLFLTFIFQIILKLSVNLSWELVRKYLSNRKLTTFLFFTKHIWEVWVYPLKLQAIFPQIKNKSWKTNPVLIYLSISAHLFFTSTYKYVKILKYQMIKNANQQSREILTLCKNKRVTLYHCLKNSRSKYGVFNC